jgi:bacteriocin-like protein
LNGLELSDEDLAAISGGKGNSDISVKGNVSGSNVSSGGGSTNVSPTTNVSAKGK